MTAHRGRPRVKKASETPLGISAIAKKVRYLAYDFARANDLKEGFVGAVFYGYLGGAFGPHRVYREESVATVPANGRRTRGRPEQIDFVIGRQRHGLREWTATTAIELAVRRKGHSAGLNSICNVTEVSKLCRARATHRVLLLIDVTNDHDFTKLKQQYINHKRTRGKPRKGKIWVIYAGAEGVHRFSIPLQRLQPKRRRPRT